jgi:hypothetical protein
MSTFTSGAARREDGAIGLQDRQAHRAAVASGGVAEVRPRFAIRTLPVVGELVERWRNLTRTRCPDAAP